MIPAPCNALVASPAAVMAIPSAGRGWQEDPVPDILTELFASMDVYLETTCPDCGRPKDHRCLSYKCRPAEDQDEAV